MTMTDGGVPAAPAADTGAGDDGAAAAAALEAIGAPADDWAEPGDLDEGVQSFDREYVEKLRDQAAGYRTRAKELHDRLGGYDPETITNYAHLADALSTTEGVREFFVEAGQALGISPQQVYALLAGQGAAPAEPEPQGPSDEELDQVMTRREFEEMLAKRVLEPQQEQLKQFQEQQAMQVAGAAVTAFIDNDMKLGGEANKSERNIILTIADGLTPQGERDPRKLIDALRQAQATWEQTKRETFTKYVNEKKVAAGTVPKTLGTNTGGASSSPEAAPKSLAEAIQRRKEGKVGI